MSDNFSAEQGTFVVDSEWAEWQARRVAQRNAREAFEDRAQGFDRRVGAGISGNRASRRGQSDRAARDHATIARVNAEFAATRAAEELTKTVG